jgi:signal transduction histidine kinase
VLAVADGERLEQALLAIVTNAVQHTEPGERIELGATASHGEIAFWVRDDGPGIDPAEHTRLFRKYSRGTGADRPDGTGLGLAIVTAIATAHGGRVEIDSRLGEGATFRVVIPRSTEPGGADLEVASG